MRTSVRSSCLVDFGCRISSYCQGFRWAEELGACWAAFVGREGLAPPGMADASKPSRAARNPLSVTSFIPTRETHSVFLRSCPTLCARCLTAGTAVEFFSHCSGI